MALSWVSVNANTGDIIADLNNVQVGGALKQTLMRYEGQTATLPIDGAPPNWRQATRKGAVFLVALDESDENNLRRPLWGGLVIRRIRTVGAGVQLSLVTAEAYFDRVYVGDQTYSNTPQNVLVKTLVEKYAKTGPLRGLPLRVKILGANGALRDRTYKDADDKTLYSVLTDLAGVLSGPEWTIEWEWVTPSRLGLVVVVGDRIGASAPTGLGPAAQFYLPGSVTHAELAEGYGSEEGANDVMAVSSGVQDARPQSPRQTVTTDLRPRFEYRWTPSTSISNISTLTSHAQRALAAMKDGTVALSLTANREESPKLGVDWHIGDDVGFDIKSPEFPDGLTGVARSVGWELTDTTITPLLDVAHIEGID